MKMRMLSIVSAVASIVAYAAPKATITSFSQDPSSGLVSVSYTVDGDSVVTAEFFSSDEAVAPEAYADLLSGTINREVSAGKTYSFTWAPDAAGNGIDLTGGNLEVRLTAWSLSSPPPYMALDLTVTNNVAYYASSNTVPGGVHDFRYKSDYVLMRRIPAKNVTWTMGLPKDAAAWDSWSTPGYRKVKLTYDYYIGVFAVTQRQHERLTKLRPSDFISEEMVDGYPAYMGRPVERVSYDAIRGKVHGAAWPNDDFDTAHGVDDGSVVASIRAVTGKLVDLPSEAEWEFACRAGCGADTYNGRTIMNDVDRTYTTEHGKIARYHGNSNTGAPEYKYILPHEGGTATVGSYEPNWFGIYDMLGNVREWCLDCWEVGVQDASIVKVDYFGPAKSDEAEQVRVLKGGAYSDGAYICSAGNCSKTSSKTTTWPTGYRLCMVIK
jgi:formylglycine-generating enzyme required for sulfatase activity